MPVLKLRFSAILNPNNRSCNCGGLSDTISEDCEGAQRSEAQAWGFLVRGKFLNGEFPVKTACLRKNN